MILFSEQPPQQAKLRPQLIAAIPGAIIGLAVAIALRWTVLSPPARVLLSTLPMYFFFGFLNPLNAKLPVWRRANRAGIVAILVCTLLAAIELAG